MRGTFGVRRRRRYGNRIRGKSPVSHGARRLHMESLEGRHLLSGSPLVATIIDDGDPGFSASTGAGNGGWTQYTGSGIGFQDDLLLSYRRPAGAEPDVATWSFSVTPGTYRVATTWLPYVNRAPDAPYRVFDGSTLLAKVEVDQRAAPNDFTDPAYGKTWEFLGEFEVGGSSLVVTLSDDVAFWSHVCADAVWIERVGGVEIIDNGDAGYATTGEWSYHTGQAFENDCELSWAHSEPSVASWSFSVEPGTYQVSATWLPFVNRADNAPYRIYDDSTELATVRVNQKQAPDDFFDSVHGGLWENLGEFDVAGDTLVVTLSNDVGWGWKCVVADAIRIQRVGGVVAITESDGSTDVDEEGPTSDSYEVALTRAPAADVVITLTPDDQVTLDKTTLTFTPANWDVPQTVTVTAVDDGIVEDRIHTAVIAHTAGSADPAFDGATLRDVVVNVTDNDIKVIDNGDAGYAATGAWTDFAGKSQGFEDDGSLSWASAEPSMASWTFSVQPGVYQVSATWLPYVNRADNAPYRIYDGSTELATVRVDQRQSPDDFADPEFGGTWEILGDFAVTGDTLVVTMANDVGGGWKCVIADAIRIERVGDVSLEAMAAVLGDGSWSVDGEAWIAPGPLDDAVFESASQTKAPKSDPIERVADPVLPQPAASMAGADDETPVVDTLFETLGDWLAV